MRAVNGSDSGLGSRFGRRLPSIPDMKSLGRTDSTTRYLENERSAPILRAMVASDAAASVICAINAIACCSLQRDHREPREIRAVRGTSILRESPLGDDVVQETFECSVEIQHRE